MKQGSEAQFEQAVEQLAAFYGWLAYHPPDNRPTTARSGRRYVQRVTPGYPDLTLVRVPELLFVELKTDTGRVAPAQRAWLDAIDAIAREWVRPLLELAAGDPSLTEGSTLLDFALEAHVWRPRDFDELHARLARGRARHEPVGPC